VEQSTEVQWQRLYRNNKVFLYSRIGGISLDAGTHPLAKLTIAAS
jgi:hypothetical protein